VPSIASVCHIQVFSISTGDRDNAGDAAVVLLIGPVPSQSGAMNPAKGPRENSDKAQRSQQSLLKTMRSHPKSSELWETRLHIRLPRRKEVVRCAQPGLLDTAMDTVSKTGASLAVNPYSGAGSFWGRRALLPKTCTSMPTLTSEKKRALH